MTDVTMEHIAVIFKWLAHIGASLGCIDLLSLGSLTGSKLITGFIVDDRERAQMSATMFWLIVLASILTSVAMIFLVRDWFPAVASATAALILWMLKMRRERFFGLMNWEMAKRIPPITAARLWTTLTYTFPIPLLILWGAMKNFSVIGYLIGLIVLAAMKIGFSKSETESTARTIWPELAVTMLTLATVLCLPLLPETIHTKDLFFQAELPIYACILGNILNLRFRNILDMIAAELMILSSKIFLSWPWPNMTIPSYISPILSTALLILFILWKRKDFYEAFLPIRAKWIRMKANM